MTALGHGRRAAMQLQDLEPLVGEWTVTIQLPGHGEMPAGRTTFEWLEGGGYLIQRATHDNPDFPKGITVIGPNADGDRIVQHYFDSRGVARVYETSFEDGVWRLWRDGPDFAQRFTGRLGADGTIQGTWERSDDGVTWMHDFHLIYRKVAERPL
jgi:hypothetical protein